MTEKSEETKDLPILMTVGGMCHKDLYRELGKHYRLLFMSTPYAQLCVEMGLTAGSLEALIDDKTKLFAKNQAMWLTSKVIDHLLDGRLAQLDPSHPALRAPEIGNWLPVVAYELMEETLVRAMAMAAVCEQEDCVAGVLVHEDVTPVARLMAQFGLDEGLPTLHIPHANYFMTPGTKDIHCQTTAEHLGVQGEHMRQWFEASGVDPDRITVLGAPQWDFLYNEELLPTREHARRALALDRDDLIVTYATTWHQETGSVWGNGLPDLQAGFQEMLVAVKELGAKVIVKLHPGEHGDNEGYYQARMHEAGVLGCLTRAHNEFAIRAADCVVTMGSSNFAVEAMIAGTPVVEHYQCGAKYPDEYGPMPGTWGNELVPMIKQAIKDGPNREFVRAMNYDDDGKAVERCVEWVRELCQV